MEKTIRERFGVLIRPTGRMEVIQLGAEGGDQSLLDALEDYFGGAVEYVRNVEQLAYVTREGAFDEGLTKNAAGSYFSGLTVFGDVIVLPKRADDHRRVRWSYADAYKRKVRMECDWSWQVDFQHDPERYKRALREKQV